MPTITLDIRKSVEGNAAVYFEKAKKAKKKLEGAKTALERTRQKLSQLIEEREAARSRAEGEAGQRKAAAARTSERKWYEKFRWFTSSEGFLCIGGRDATTNEIIIKKHTGSSDIVFHTELAGSPFFVVNGKASPATIEEAAIATASYSRAWKAGLQLVDTYWVKPEQVSKEAKAGEYLTKGAFMIYGKKNQVPAKTGLAIGVTGDGRVMGGPEKAVAANCARFARLTQGNDKPSDAAKKIIRLLQLDGSYIDEVIRALPAGNLKGLSA